MRGGKIGATPKGQQRALRQALPFSVRPGMALAITDHLLPCARWSSYSCAFSASDLGTESSEVMARAFPRVSPTRGFLTSPSC